MLNMPFEQRSAVKRLSHAACIADLSVVHAALTGLATLPPVILGNLDRLPRDFLSDAGGILAGMMPRQLVDAALGGNLDSHTVGRLRTEHGIHRRTRGSIASNIKRLQ